VEFGLRTDWQEKILEYAINYSHTARKDYMNFLKDSMKGKMKIDAKLRKPIGDKNEMHLALS
jgi:hypothetical protein